MKHWAVTFWNVKTGGKDYREYPQIGAINSHLSIQQAQNFVLKNAGDKYEFITLHQSKEF